MSDLLKELALLVGFGRNSTNHKEKLISGLGAGIAIALAFIAGQALLNKFGYTMGLLQSSFLATSMAASTVLLFAVPHGALSQPWPVFGGHLVSAVIGVSSLKIFGLEPIAAFVAVSVSVTAMYYLRCIHPPGGATALAAVMGGSATESMGYFYVVFPVLTGVAVLLIVAVVFNYPFSWRRYPAHLFYKGLIVNKAESFEREFEITQEDFFAAIQQHGSFVDVTEEGLTELLELAKQHAEMNVEHPSEIKPGKFYSNGKLGKLWSVRQIIDAENPEEKSLKKKIIYKVVAGNGSYDTGICFLDEFRQWARFEVAQQNKLWVKVG